MAGSSVEEICRLVGFPDGHWDVLCAPMMLKAQQQDRLDLVRRALRLRQGLYLPVGAVAEDIYLLRDIWTYAVMVAALIKQGMRLNDIPPKGLQWLRSNTECFHHLDMVATGKHAGMLHEILQRAAAAHPKRVKGSKGRPPAPDERERVKGESPKVQTELSQDSDSNIMSDPTQDAGNALGNRFLKWLREGISSGEMKVNAPGARIHIVPEGVLLVSPVIFKDFDKDIWKNTENELLSMGIHKAGSSTNVSKYVVKTPKGSGVYISGILIPEVSLLFKSPPSPNFLLQKVLKQDDER